MSGQSDQPTKHYVEIFKAKENRWETLDSFPDDARALRALVKARDQNPQARVRITNDQAKFCWTCRRSGREKRQGAALVVRNRA